MKKTILALLIILFIPICVFSKQIPTNESVPQEIRHGIRELIEKEQPDFSKYQKGYLSHPINLQIKAYNFLKNYTSVKGVPQDLFDAFRDHHLRLMSYNYTTQKHYLEMVVKDYLRFKKFKSSKGIPQDIFDRIKKTASVSATINDYTTMIGILESQTKAYYFMEKHKFPKDPSREKYIQLKKEFCKKFPLDFEKQQNFVETLIKSYSYMKSQKSAKDLPQDVFNRLKKDICSKNPLEFSTQEFKINEQIEAFQYMKNFKSADGVPQNVFNLLKETLKSKLPYDYSQQKFLITIQIKAYRFLEKYKSAEGISKKLFDFFKKQIKSEKKMERVFSKRINRKKWGQDYFIFTKDYPSQKYFIETQVKSYLLLKKFEYADSVSKNILDKIKNEFSKKYPDDYIYQKRWIEKFVRHYQFLKKCESADSIPDIILYQIVKNYGYYMLGNLGSIDKSLIKQVKAYLFLKKAKSAREVFNQAYENLSEKKSYDYDDDVPEDVFKHMKKVISAKFPYDYNVQIFSMLNMVYNYHTMKNYNSPKPDQTAFPQKEFNRIKKQYCLEFPYDYVEQRARINGYIFLYLMFEGDPLAKGVPKKIFNQIMKNANMKFPKTKDSDDIFLYHKKNVFIENQLESYHFMENYKAEKGITIKKFNKMKKKCSSNFPEDYFAQKKSIEKQVKLLLTKSTK